jgi:hypothetical protein
MILAADTVGWSTSFTVFVAVMAVSGMVFLAIVVGQVMKTWRARISGTQEEAYRALAERATQAQERTAQGLETSIAQLAEVDRRTAELERMLKEVQ